MRAPPSRLRLGQAYFETAAFTPKVATLDCFSGAQAVTADSGARRSHTAAQPRPRAHAASLASSFLCRGVRQGGVPPPRARPCTRAHTRVATPLRGASVTKEAEARSLSLVQIVEDSGWLF